MESALLDIYPSIPTIKVCIDAYAGDVSNVSDKLPCTRVMQAVTWAMERASHVSSRYNLRSLSRSYVTINTYDAAGCHLGRASDPLSKLFCMHCEHEWLSSLFDASRFTTTGVIRSTVGRCPRPR